MNAADRDRFNGEIRAHLAHMDGTTRAAVSLLSGIPADQLDHLGGITEEDRALPGTGEIR